MQTVQAGKHKLLVLELDPEFLENVLRQAGFDCRIEDNKRNLILHLKAPDREAPLLLFDAADPGNLGWFSRCQFYVDGTTGGVLQTPIYLANAKDRSGRILPNALRMQINKELPDTFRMPGRQAVSEQVVYAILYNLLNALQNVGVAVCGGSLIKPLAGRGEK